MNDAICTFQHLLVCMCLLACWSTVNFLRQFLPWPGRIRQLTVQDAARAVHDEEQLHNDTRDTNGNTHHVVVSVVVTPCQVFVKFQGSILVKSNISTISTTWVSSFRVQASKIEHINYMR
jgi:hypothetical protein